VSLSILADEVVERVVVTALRSNGYDVAVADERYGEGTVDEDLLRDAAERDEVVLTHDRDFVALAESYDHAGILLLAAQSPDPGSVVRAVDRLLTVFTRSELENELVWVEEWM
jgi:predicted nuclease of predicted toxin-antitoxin system